MAARHSYLYHILKYLGESRAWSSKEDIFSELLRAKNTLMLEERSTLTVPKDLEALDEVLSRLKEIGVLRTHEGGGGRELWALAAETANGENEGNAFAKRESGDSVRGSDGRGGGRDGNGPGDDGPEGEGGGGLSEVLAHPVLFCLDEEHQDQRLRAALGLSPNGLDTNNVEAV